MSGEMFFLSAATLEPEAGQAVADLAQQVRAQLAQRPDGADAALDLMLVFLSAHYTQQARYVIDDLRQTLAPKTILGCTAEGVIGSQQEIEELPAITLVAAHLPGVEVRPFLLQTPDTDWSRLLLDSEEFQRVVDANEQTRLFIVLGDPFSTPMDDVLEAFNSNFPGIPVSGGMASGALRPQGNALFCNDRMLHEGVVGVGLSGALDVDVIVSQGCRPIWRPFRVSTAHRNVIFNLEGRPPLTWIQELIPELSEDDRFHRFFLTLANDQ